jgi:putative peptide zinc metalloprotease protein
MIAASCSSMPPSTWRPCSSRTGASAASAGRGARTRLPSRWSSATPSACWSAFACWASGCTRRQASFLWLLLVGAGVATALVHLPQLVAHADSLMSTPRWMFLAWLLYPVIKLVHEAAHGLAVHRWGGRVREFGVLLLAMVPVPFVNASAADGFRFRHQRALVSAAGIMAELAMAAAAMLLWTVLQSSLLRDLALLVAITGLLSTLLVNGNPLMRFDGYFLLCDLLDLRNLAPRSARWWADAAKRRVLGVAPSAPLEALPGERGWLVAYAPLALVYRLVLSFAIVLWLGSWSALLGSLLGLYLAVTLVAWPLWRLVRGTGRAISAQPRRLAPTGRALAAGVGVLLLFALPLPFGTVAQGVVWVPERTQIRAGTDGFIEAVLVADGQPVAAGEVLVRLRDDRLDLEWARLEADRAGLETQMYQAIVGKPDDVPALRERLQYVEAGLQRVAEQRAGLEVRAQVAGRVVLQRPEEQAGRFFRKGDLLGYVGTDDPMVVRVALPQDQAQLVRERSGPIAVRLAQDSALQQAYPARLQRDMEAAVARLPSSALGDRGGGDLVTRADDPEGLTPREPVVLMDLDVPAVRSPWIGARVAVRFDHGTMDLATQVVRRIRQLVLDRFDVQG